jgi:hypothetical protein
VTARGRYRDNQGAGPDGPAAELVPDLVAIIACLLAAAGQPALSGAQLAVLDRGRAILAGFHEDALAWAAGAGPVPGWQSWANRLALALGELAAALEAPAVPGPGQDTGGGLA